MLYFVFSDVHGHYNILKNELIKKGFDENNPNHMLISMGDNFDRGPENYEMFQFLKDMNKKSKIIMITGNHEDLLVKMLQRGYPTQVDFSNGTYGTLNEFYKRYFNISEGNIQSEDFYDTYKKMVEDGFFELLDNMIDYYEIEKYIFTHGFIPVIGDTTPYLENNCTYKENWRNSSVEEFKSSRWTNGIKMSINFKIGEPQKRIVIGHIHSSYGNVRKDLGYNISDEIYRQYRNSNYKYNLPYIDKRVIAIDACTILSKSINILMIEE